MIRTFQTLAWSSPVRRSGDDPNREDLDSNRRLSGRGTYTRLEHEILDRVTALAGVASAGFASEVPMEGPGNNGPVAVEGQTPEEGRSPPGRKWRFISPGYFEAMARG